jgi:hypothetical protein
MNWEPIEKIANAVLYEGFLLYPYRKSSIKNLRRWHFGTIGPSGGPDPTTMQTECLVEGNGGTSIEIKIRFLQNEVEREVELDASPVRREFFFPHLQFATEVERANIIDNIFRLTIRILNTASDRSASDRTKDDGAMLSTHTLLSVREGAFVSLLDPPDHLRAAARDCRNIGTWPVLAGKEGERQFLLSSPIILYDYPQIAPESPGDFFDGTEMDEMLTLRLLTLSDDEKREVREAGDHGREILERTETLPPEQLGKMHGAIRNLRKASKLEFREGDRVRLHPAKKADIFDIALDGKVAIVESVERDFEDRIHLAVTVEDDPGRDFGIARQIAHRFFFSPEEVELL